MDVNERLSAVLKTLGLTQMNFAESIGVTQSTLSKQLKGVHKIDKQEALAIKAVYDINPSWLLTGEGEMFISSPKDQGKDKPVKNTAGVRGNAQPVPGIKSVDQILATEWFAKLSGEQKEIITGLAVIKEKDILKKVSAIISSQVAKERAHEELNRGLEELGGSGAGKRKK